MTDIIARLRHECELLRPESNWRQLTEEAVTEIEKLQEALVFYAEKNSWRHTISLGHPQIDGTTSAALQDSGNIARTALGEKETTND